MEYVDREESDDEFDDVSEDIETLNHSMMKCGV